MSFEDIGQSVIGYANSIGIFGLATQISNSVISHMPVIVLALFDLIVAVVIIRIIMKVF